MIGQSLVEGPLEIGGAHSVGEVTVCTVAEKELSLVGHGSLDVLPTIDVLLATVHNTNVTCSGSDNIYSSGIYFRISFKRGQTHSSKLQGGGGGGEQIQIQGGPTLYLRQFPGGGGERTL